MIFYAEPISPLKHSAEAVQKLIYCARRRIPMVYTPCCIGGGTAPATLAGVLVQNLAETLGGVVLSQTISKGTPIVVGGVVSILDMHTTILSYGAPELSLLSAGATEVARHLGLPMFSTGGCTDSKCVDQQAAVEATTSLIFAVLSGASFVHDVGYTESGMTGSLQQLMMGNEIIGMARHIAGGIRVDEETLAVEAIAQASEEGDYLGLDHTARHFRDQFWFPQLSDRYRHGEWEAGGEQTMGHRMRERVRKVLSEHRADPLAGEVTAKLDEIAGE
jgi:trimethylamine--corrinoid protein Co-methyltransferase